MWWLEILKGWYEAWNSRNFVRKAWFWTLRTDLRSMRAGLRSNQVAQKQDMGNSPKGPMSCRTQAWISFYPSHCLYVHPPVHPSVHPHPASQALTRCFWLHKHDSWTCCVSLLVSRLVTKTKYRFFCHI